jgi:hypothetical protein
VKAIIKMVAGRGESIAKNLNCIAIGYILNKALLIKKEWRI